MFGIPENSVLLNRKTNKNRNFFFKILKKKNFELSVVRESRKFSNPEREYRIPENPIPGLFGNTEFPKMFYSRTSGFPKQKNSGILKNLDFTLNGMPDLKIQILKIV